MHLGLFVDEEGAMYTTKVNIYTQEADFGFAFAYPQCLAFTNIFLMLGTKF